MRFAKCSSVYLFLLCWVVSGNLERVIDGDTFVVKLDVWPKMQVTEHVRLEGVDTPELKGIDKDRAFAAKDFAAKWLSSGPFSVETCGVYSFNRLVAKVYRDGGSLAEELKKAGYAE